MTSFNNALLPNVFHGDPVPANTLSGGRGRGFSPIEYRVSYLNQLSSDVTIVWRSGFSFTIPPDLSSLNRRFITRLEISIHPTVKVDIHRLLHAIESSSNSALIAMRDAIDTQMTDNPYGGVMLTIDYPISEEELRNHGGAVYYSELDEVISILPVSETPLHPYSDRGQIYRGAGEYDIVSKQNGFVYSLVVVDNYSRYGERYLNIAGQVYNVKPCRDFTRRDGVYLMTSGACEGSLGGTAPAARRVDLDSAEKALCLYRSFEEAKIHGTEEAVRKRIEMELEHRTTVLKTQATESKQLYELEKLEKEKEQRQNEEERERHKRELERIRGEAELASELRRMEIKDQYEVRSHVRKDSSETLKVLPTLAVGLGAAVMALKSFF